MSPQYGTCFTAPYWHTKYRGVSQILKIYILLDYVTLYLGLQNKWYKSLNNFCICMPTCDFLVQTTWEHTSKQQGQQPHSSVRTEHEAQLLLLCSFTKMWKKWSVTPLWLLVSSTSNILTLLWCSPSKARVKVMVHIPSLVQRGRRDTAILILDLGYRWRGEWSHHTQPIYPQEREQVLNV